MNPFEHFEEQDRSWAHLQELGPHLALMARTVLAEKPEAVLAGLLVERGSSEYKQLRTALEQATGLEETPAGIGGLLTAESALELASGIGGPEAREWLSEHVGDPGHLPILACTRNGMRMAVEPIPPP